MASTKPDEHQGVTRPTRLSATDQGVVQDGRDPEPPRPRRFTLTRRRHTADLPAAAALFVLALVTRHGTLPHDGLIYDDAWVAVGAMKARVGDLLAVSTNHPGFTALLMGWARLIPSRAEWMALPAYVGGAAIVPALYLVLRRLRTPWSVGLLVAALVLVAPAHVYYSGRVKSYVIEGTVILVLAVALPRLVRRRWDWQTMTLWVGIAVVVGTFSAFTLVAVAAAAVILALHPNGDRLRRWGALGVQALIHAGYLALVQSSFDSAQVAADWERVYDGYIEVTADPGSMVRQLGAHLARVGDAVASGGKAVTLGIVLVALVGLGWEAWRGARALVARFLLLLLAIAFVGSLLRQMPFGPAVGNPVFPGTRATLWLLPSLALGLAFALELAHRVLSRTLPSAVLPLSIGFLFIAGVVLARNVDDAPRYLDTGARSAQRWVEERRNDQDLVVALPTATWSYAAEPGVDVRIRSAPDTLTGFSPQLSDPRVWEYVGPSAGEVSVEQLARRLGGARQVFVLHGFVGYGDRVVTQLEAQLTSLGYQDRGGLEVSVFRVSQWGKRG